MQRDGAVRAGGGAQILNNPLSHQRLQAPDALRIIRPPRGGIAQLGERLHGMQEVSGSIPLTSTKSRRW